MSSTIENYFNGGAAFEFELVPGRKVGPNHPCFVIAEAGNNHQGEVPLAKKLIDLAVEAGCECVKFQKRTTNAILTKAILNRPYTGRNAFGPTYGEHRDALELSFSQFEEVKKYAESKNIAFTASGWDEASVDFLADVLDVPFFKMASADLSNFPLLEHTAKKGKPMVISTGMADIALVRKAVALIKQHNPHVVVLQCCSCYPAAPEDLNLKVIRTYQEEFGKQCVIGYSGHENGVAISVGAMCIGARVIERHITLDRSMRGSDHAASLEKEGISNMVAQIRKIETAFGTYSKTIHPKEIKIKEKLAKSIVSRVAIPKGTKIERSMLCCKSPGSGISPMEIDSVVGKSALEDIPEDVTISTEQLS